MSYDSFIDNKVEIKARDKNNKKMGKVLSSCSQSLAIDKGSGPHDWLYMSISKCG